MNAVSTTQVQCEGKAYRPTTKAAQSAVPICSAIRVLGRIRRGAAFVVGCGGFRGSGGSGRRTGQARSPRPIHPAPTWTISTQPAAIRATRATQPACTAPVGAPTGPWSTRTETNGSTATVPTLTARWPKRRIQTVAQTQSTNSVSPASGCRATWAPTPSAARAAAGKSPRQSSRSAAGVDRWVLARVSDSTTDWTTTSIRSCARCSSSRVLP